jgi:hypothetical protein
LRSRALSWRRGVSGILAGRISHRRSRCIERVLAFLLVPGVHSEYGHPNAEGSSEANTNYDFAG